MNGLRCLGWQTRKKNSLKNICLLCTYNCDAFGFSEKMLLHKAIENIASTTTEKINSCYVAKVTAFNTLQSMLIKSTLLSG